VVWTTLERALLSVRVTIVNTGGRPLLFDAADDQLQVILPPGHPTSGEGDGYREAHGGPAPRLAEAGPIAPHGRATGWASFVVPLSAQSVIDQPPADLMVGLPGHRESEIGEIRPWKWASPTAQRAVGLSRR
jgi:hypothetical protein